MSEKEKKKTIKFEKDSDEIPVEELKELFGVINAEIPDLIRNLFASLYDATTAEQYAKGVGTIYKSLTEQGLPPEMVERLVDNYASSINVLGAALKNIEIDTKKKRDED